MKKIVEGWTCPYDVAIYRTHTKIYGRVVSDKEIPQWCKICGEKNCKPLKVTVEREEEKANENYSNRMGV